MNKARMTIRFDHESSTGQECGSIIEQEPECLQLSPNEISEMGDLHVRQSVEVLDRQHMSTHNNPRENLRSSGRLAEERRRMEQQDDDLLRWDEVNHFNNDVMPPEIDHNHHSAALPEEGDVSLDYGYYRSRKPVSVWKVAGSVAGAVITGILFGTVVLSIFSGEDTGNEISIPAKEIGSTSSASSNYEAENGLTNIQDLTAIHASAAVAIPEQTFYMLQYGVFSTAERAEQAKGELVQSGIAAFGDTTVENRVYAGVSPDREQAKLLSNQLKNEGVELYVREVILPGAQSAAFAGEAAALDIFFEMSGELTAKLSSLSATLLGLESPGPVDAETINTITGLHLQWTEAVKMVSSGLSPETERNLSLMGQEMSSSITALTEYNKNQSKGHLWEIQEGMMKYIMGQRKLVESLQSIIR
ncbi:SPOR domain-containing protein [Paenibacillus dakarensis]|uniref:SPOR domain-containing protein n=1 Tax=Paenibacillus dakarensis TaxID=1527293 RepID=UPI0006D53FA8|nr:SPOR domain-containing protein [Paenibacillus dakarensis]